MQDNTDSTDDISAVSPSDENIQALINNFSNISHLYASCLQESTIVILETYMEIKKSLLKLEEQSDLSEKD